MLLSWLPEKSGSESQPVVSDSLWPHGLYSPWNSPGQNTGVGSCSLLQGICLTQGLNAGLPHCRQILYQLSHQGSPSMLEWIAHPFSSESYWPRNWTRVSCLTGRLFTSWATRESPGSHPKPLILAPGPPTRVLLSSPVLSLPSSFPKYWLMSISSHRSRSRAAT